MALSGTIYGTTNNKYIDAKLVWSATQNTTENYSTITATLYYSRTNEGYQTYGKWVGDITINGTTVSAENRITITYQSNTEAMSATVKVPHNSDGTKSCTISASGGFPGLSMDATYLSATVTLNEIARQATIVSAPDFNDENNPTITYTNKAGGTVTSLQACISLTGSSPDIAYRDISKTGNSYTFTLSDGERRVLRAATTGKSRTVKFYVKTVLNGKTYYSSITKTYSIVNANPTLAPTVIDTDAATIALTGSNERLIKYFSDAKYTIGAKAIKEATLASQKVTCGGKSATTASGTLTNVESGNFEFTATDSRGFSTTQTVKKTIVNYIKLTCNCEPSTPTAQGGMTLTIKGNYFNGGFGAKNNTLTISYRSKTNDGAYGAWTAATATISGNTYSVSITLSGLNYQSKYTFQARAADLLMTVNSAEKSVKTTPVFDWSKDDFRHNTDVVIANQKSIQGTRQDGTTVVALEPCNSSNNTVLGYGNYSSEIGSTNIYGTNIRLYTKDKLLINGREYGANKVLWSGAYYMNASQTANLSEPISAQPNGIILVFSLYRDGAAADASVCTFFVSKKEVELMPNAGHTFFLMINSGFSVIGAKYLTINDTSLTGNATNATNGTNNNMTFTNTSFVLRYVIGV